jgi:hypothetical protein
MLASSEVSEFDLLCKVLVEDSLWLDSFALNVMPAICEKAERSSGHNIFHSEGNLLKPAFIPSNKSCSPQEVGKNASTMVTKLPANTTVVQKTYGLLKRASSMESKAEKSTTSLEPVPAKRQRTVQDSDPREGRIHINSLLN